MGTDELLTEHREEILRLAAKHGARNVRVFGSVARGDAGPGSDVDLLVDVVGPTTPWFPGGLVNDLERLLGRPVEVVEESALREALRGQVLAEAVAL